MKILYHHRTASKDGQAVHIEEMIAAMRKIGHEVRVVAPSASVEGQMGGGVGWIHQLKNVLPKAIYELLELAYSVIAYRQLKAAANEFKPDFIYERYNLFLMAGSMLRRRLGVPLLLEVNSPLVHERSQHSGGLALRRLAKWAEGKVWRSSDYVLPVTQALGQYVLNYGVPENRIAVIPNGINEAHFTNAPDTETAKFQLGLSGKLVLGFTGFVRDWHGVDRVIRWMASSQAPENIFLLVVGDGPARVDLETLAKTLQLSAKVRFSGTVDRSRVPELVAAFDIALQPAVTAYASPLKLMEYLVMGKAIVAPREPNLMEILTDGENALLFDRAMPESFESALSRLCGQPGLRSRLAVGAKASIQRLNLTWEGNARRVTELAGRSLVMSRSGGRK